MSSNFEWQKFQANERVRARLNDAQAHRQVKSDSNRSPLVVPLKLALALSAGLLIAIWFLTACTTVGGEAQAPDPPAAESATGVVTAWTMADRIRFHDRIFELEHRQTANAERFVASNPGLKAVDRHTLVGAMYDEPAFLARNPELSAARRYALLRATR